MLVIWTFSRMGVQDLGERRKSNLSQDSLYVFLTAGQPEDCVANRMGFCFSDMETSFENQHNTVSPSFNYIECYEASDPHPACDPPSQMLNDFIWNGRSIMKKEWDRIRQ